MTSFQAAASCLLSMMRSSVWQLTQRDRMFFCRSVPGTLVIHSRLVSCAAMFLVLTSLRSRLSGAPASVTVDGPVRSYPVARMLSVYSPGPSFAAGKLNSPLSLLTTLTVTMPFLARMTTPSIRPSSAEETLPVSAAGAAV